tara:strand:+ start:299 stop:1420 length:1122 start_codon:yes stop_codon:yes gene_type:complete
MATVYYYSQASGDNDGTSEANAFEDLQTALNSLSGGDHLYCKRHSSREGVKTTNLTCTTDSEAAAGNTIVEGYTTTPGDGGMYQTHSPIAFVGDGIEIRYMDVDADGDASDAIKMSGDGCMAYRCIAVNSYGFGNAMEIIDGSAVECYVKGKVTQAGDTVLYSNRAHVINCTVVISSDSGAAGSAIAVGAAFRINKVVGCLLINEDSDGPQSHVGIRIIGNSAGASLIANNTVTNMDIGIEHVEGTVASRVSTPSIFYGNILYSVADGIKNTQNTNTVNFGLIAISNAFGAVTTAQTTNLASVIDSVTLTESPFIDTTNFQLNNAPGGGALLKGKLGRGSRFDPSLLSTDPRIDFTTHGGIQPNPNNETSHTF